MKFENDFTVAAPVDEVWTTLMDVERVAPCMPGAEVLDRTGDNAYKVGIRVKVGPISMLYRGQVEIIDRDDSAHTATMRAKAREARGQGTADASVHMSVEDHSEGAHATMATDLQLSGRAAAMGRGVIGDVAEKLVQTFADNLAGMLAEPGAAPAEAAPAAAAPAGVAPAEAAAVAAASAPEPASGGAAPQVPEPPKAPEPASAPEPAGAPPGDGAQAPGVAALGPTPPAETPPPAPPSAPRATPPPPRPPRPASGGDSLPIGDIAASVIAGRLRNPRNLLIATGALGLTFGAIGYVLGKSR